MGIFVLRIKPYLQLSMLAVLLYCQHAITLKGSLMHTPTLALANGITAETQHLIEALDSKSTDGWVFSNLELLRAARQMFHAAIVLASKNGLTSQEIEKALQLSPEVVSEFLTKPVIMPLKQGSIVRAKDPYGNPLRSGASLYNIAIVVSVEPFIMVSEGTDMLWQYYPASEVEVIGEANENLLAKCFTRYNPAMLAEALAMIEKGKSNPTI